MYIHADHAFLSRSSAGAVWACPQEPLQSGLVGSHVGGLDDALVKGASVQHGERLARRHGRVEVNEDKGLAAALARHLDVLHGAMPVVWQTASVARTSNKSY